MGRTDHARWRADYVVRAEPVQRDLGALFQRAVTREVLAEISTIRRKTASIRYLRRQRPRFPHRLVLFTYSSRFDAKAADELLDPEVTRAALPPGLTAQGLFERKAARLEEAFTTLVRVADGAGHYTAALLARCRWAELPLVWEVPVEDPEKTGYPRDAMWWLSFQYLCEMARAIVAFGGITPLMFNELCHIRGNPRLRRKLLWLDGDLNLLVPERDEEQWPLRQLPVVLQKIEAARKRGGSREDRSGTVSPRATPPRP